MPIGSFVAMRIGTISGTYLLEYRRWVPDIVPILIATNELRRGLRHSSRLVLTCRQRSDRALNANLCLPGLSPITR
jgi:hypothetical protein